MKTYLSGKSFLLGEILPEIIFSRGLSPINKGASLSRLKTSVPVRTMPLDFPDGASVLYHLDRVTGVLGAVLAPVLSFS